MIRRPFLHSVVAVAAAMLMSPATASAASPLCAASLERIDRSAAATMSQGAPGMIVAVAHAGKPVLVRGYGIADLEQRTAMTGDSVFRMASLTKQFTAGAVLALAEDGKLTLDDPLARHLPDLERPLGRITLRQLL